MHHFGVICPPGHSHITGMAAIGRELSARGHRVTFFNIADVETLCVSQGVGFLRPRKRRSPAGLLCRVLGPAFQLERAQCPEIRHLGGKRRNGDDIEGCAGCHGLSRGHGAHRRHHGELPGSTLAERLKIPFVTICNAIPAFPDSSGPPPFTPWSYHYQWFSRLRNRSAKSILNTVLRPMLKPVNLYRRRWSLKPLTSLYASPLPARRDLPDDGRLRFPQPFSASALSLHRHAAPHRLGACTLPV